MHGVYRVVNILIGCAIAGVACFTIRPIPTHKRIVIQVEELSKVTGESVRKLINTVAELSKAQNGPVDGQKTEVSIPDQLFLPTITEIVRNPDPTSLDEVHDSYITSVDLWKECRQSLQLLVYDPVFRTKFDKAMQKEFRDQIRLRLARMFRIHAVVIIVDSLLRGGFHRGGYLTGNAVETLKAIGARIETLLDPSASIQDCSDIARRLVDQDILQIRQHARMFQMQSSMTLTSFSSSSNGNDDNSSIETAHPEAALAGEELWSLLANLDRPYPLAQLDGPSQSSLLFRLVEHLVLKVVRLHHLNKFFQKEVPQTA